MKKLKGPLRRFLKVLRSPYLLPGEYRERLDRYVQVEKGTFARDAGSDLANLRKYAHMLDKALQRDGWQPGHARNTLSAAEKLLKRFPDGDDPSLAWARHVVQEFRTREGSGSCSAQISTDPKPSPLQPELLMKHLKYRTSCRVFAERPVEAATLESIVEAALEGSWSCHRQALRVYGSVNPEKSVQILKFFRGFTGFSSYVPCAVVLCFDLRPYGMPKEIFVPHMDTGIAAGNAALMAASFGLSMTFLSWGSRTAEAEAGLRQTLAIPDFVEVAVGAACGYPLKTPLKPVRKRVCDTLIKV